MRIEERIAEQERTRLKQETARLETALRSEFEKKIATMNAERVQREERIRKEEAHAVEARLKADATKRMAAVVAERDRTLVRVKELETTSEKHAQDLEQQRAALEKDRNGQLLKLTVEHQRQKAQLQKKVNTLSRQLQRKTADELGEGAEVDIHQALRDAFAHDEIVRVKRGEPGADIRHTVLQKGVACGTILVDSKNRQGWQNAYVAKLREDQLAAKADHAVLATSVFPTGKSELYIDEETGVIVVSRPRVVEIVELLRSAMIKLHTMKLSLSERGEKRDLLYRFIVSEEYREHQREAARIAGELAELDVEEKREHDKVWMKRGRMTTRLRNSVRQIEVEIGAILEGHSPGAADPDENLDV